MTDESLKGMGYGLMVDINRMANKMITQARKDPELPHKSDWNALEIQGFSQATEPFEQNGSPCVPSYKWHSAIIGKRRSDDGYFFVQIVIPPDATALKALSTLRSAMVRFNSYTVCDCVPGIPCEAHKPVEGT